MLLKDHNLTIRPATKDDAGILCTWWNDGHVMAHAGFPNGLGTAPEAIVESLAKDGDTTGRRLILEVDSTPVGEMSYRNLGSDVVEIGIKICDSARQGKGLGTRFLKLLIAYLFDELGFEKVVLDTNLKNTRAQHVYEKLGFRKVGVRIHSWKDQLGRLQSAVDYELTQKLYIMEGGNFDKDR